MTATDDGGAESAAGEVEWVGLAARAEGLVARADRMMVRASSATTIDAIVTVGLAVRALRTGLGATPPDDTQALRLIAAQISTQAARLDGLQERPGAKTE